MKSISRLLIITLLLSSVSLFSQTIPNSVHRAIPIVMPDFCFPLIGLSTDDIWFHANGNQANYGDIWFHANGNQANYGDIWFHANGNQANYGDTWFHANGNQANY